MQETTWREHLPLSVPQEKEYNGAIACANKYQHLYAKCVQWKSTLLFSSYGTQITDKGTSSRLDYLNKSRPDLSNTCLLVQ